MTRLAHPTDVRIADPTHALTAGATGSRTAHKLPGVGPTVVLGGLAATLALLPFEGLLLRWVETRGWTFSITDVEMVALVTLVAWLVLLASDRRRPAVPAGVVSALAALALVTAVSAAAAGANTPLGTQVASRAALAWGMFLVAADLVRHGRTALGLVAVLLTTFTISAAVGWVSLWSGSMDGLFGADRLFTVGGVARMAGTWDYPTIAAMAWESGLLVGLPLVAFIAGGRDRIGRGRLTPRLLVPVLALVGAAALMTLTRGAFVGLAAGLGAIVVGAALLRSRRLAAIAVFAGGLLAGGAVLLYAAVPLPVERLVTESDRALYGAEYRVPGRLVVAPGSRLEIDVTLTNTGLARWRPDADEPWRLAAVWLTPDTRVVARDHQVVATLPGPVAPGESVTVRAALDVPGVPSSLDLAWDMQQGGVVDFSERDVPVALTRVDIDPAGVGRPVAATDPVRLLLYPEQLPILDRAQLWTAAIRLVERHPLLGVGPGAYRRVYGAQLGLSRWDTRIHANDLYLELAATTGLLGLAAFVLTVVLSAGQQVRALSGMPRAPSPSLGALLVVGSLAATAAAFAHGILDHFLVFVPMAILFWSLLGMGVGLAGGLGRAATAPTGPDV